MLRDDDADGRARALGLELDDTQSAKLIFHLDLVDEWGKMMNLTAIRERSQQITKHVLDSLTVLPWLRGPTIATSAAAPVSGIPLAIASPAEIHADRFHRQKCRFLEHVRDALELGNVQVAQSRAEDFARRTIQHRAGAEPWTAADLVRYGGKLVLSDGRLLAMKGRSPEAGARQAVARLESGRSAQADRAGPR